MPQLGSSVGCDYQARGMGHGQQGRVSFSPSPPSDRGGRQGQLSVKVSPARRKACQFHAEDAQDRQPGEAEDNSHSRESSKFSSIMPKQSRKQKNTSDHVRVCGNK